MKLDRGQPELPQATQPRSRLGGVCSGVGKGPMREGFSRSGASSGFPGLRSSCTGVRRRWLSRSRRQAAQAVELVACFTVQGGAAVGFVVAKRLDRLVFPAAEVVVDREPSSKVEEAWGVAPTDGRSATASACP